ncbi:cellulose biosynthesis protein [Diplodia corticola]|uniref:Cellulose biosynthesis protein n=1 Tax=Diplodia corticola TaxID=236234 RepID=A0A1J9QZL6_9PEZI|nr:cellulose biosynthesis protein [Diplodia corticola]OJD33832.1 cellulose biosynthesis protein [Diplodia corticola]
MKEILVHLSAPTSRKDDERYRRLAEAYDDFEPATTIDCTARKHMNPPVDPGDYQTPANSKGFQDRNPRPDDAKAGASAVRVAETPAAAGFVETAQIVPASRQSVAKGKRPEIFAQAPDFGSFMSTPASGSPVEQLHELEKRWAHQKPSSVKRSASSQPRTSTGGSTPRPLYTEDTQEALAMLEDYVDTSFYGSDAPFSDIESPITQGTSKRPRLSFEPSPSETYRAQYHAGTRKSTTPPIPSTWIPPPRTPPREDMSSQMIDDYGFSNSESSLRNSEGPRPMVESNVGADENLRPAPENDVRQPSEVPESHGAHQEGARQEPRQSQVSTQDVSDDSPAIGAPNAGGERRADATTTPLEPSIALAAAHAHGSPNCDFGSLPLQLFPKATPSGSKRVFNEVTSMLQLYAEKASIAKHYKPALVWRDIRPTERGCWMFDTSNWSHTRQHEFWTRMEYLTKHGYLGNAWLQRNIAKDWKRGGTDGREAEGLGVVWMFCWGQAVPYLWIVLLTESHLEIRRKKSSARWVVGPMESLEIVVKMPEPAND